MLAQDVGTVNDVPSSPLHNVGQAPKGDAVYDPQEVGASASERPPSPPLIFPYYKAMCARRSMGFQ